MDCVTFEAVEEAIQKLHPGEATMAKYVDEDGDFCTLCHASFLDFVTISDEQKGKKILKLTLISQSPKTSDCERSARESEPVASCGKGKGKGKDKGQGRSLGMPWGECAAHEFELVSTWGKGKGKGKGCAKGKSWGEGMSCSETLDEQVFQSSHGHLSCNGGMGIKKHLKFLLSQLYSNEALNADSAAALGIYFLPTLLSKIVDKHERIDRRVKKHFPSLRAIIEDLHGLVASIPGLEQVECDIADLLADPVTSSASEMLISLLTALDVLPLEGKVAFFKAFYESQEVRLQEKVQHMHQWMSHRVPSMPLVHPGVTCDGCNQSPIQGMRFKCKSRSDYDLCTRCYIQQDLVHGGECAAHEFELVSPWGKGKGKGKGCAKGKGWGKGMGCSEVTHDFDFITPPSKWKGKGKSFGKGKGFGKGIEINSSQSLKEVETDTEQVSLKLVQHTMEQKKEDLKEVDLKQAQEHLLEMGLGDGDVLVQLLQNHGGNMQQVIEELLMEEEEEEQ